jgi:hypothetical protein
LCRFYHLVTEGTQAAQAGPEHLPPLAECCCGHTLKVTQDSVTARVRQEVKPYNG